MSDMSKYSNWDLANRFIQIVWEAAFNYKNKPWKSIDKFILLDKNCNETLDELMRRMER